jgi:hypothetical protein
MAPQSNERGKRRPVGPVEVSDHDGGKFEYFSTGKKKSMKMGEFQRISVFGDEKYRRLLNTMYEFVGPLQDLAARFYGLPEEQSGRLGADRLGEARSMLGNLMSLGLVKYVVSASEFGKGGYYSLTPEGVERYVEYLTDKVPTPHKDFLKDFPESEGGRRLASKHALMLVCDSEGLETLVGAVAAHGSGPVPVQRVLRLHLEYRTEVRGDSEESVSGEEYREDLLSRVRALVSGGLLKAGSREGQKLVALTERGRKLSSSAVKIFSKMSSECSRFGLVKKIGGSGGLPAALALTSLGADVRTEHLDRISQELRPVEGGYSSGDPPVPIDELEGESPQVYKLRLTTGEVYSYATRFFLFVRDKVSSLSASGIFWLWAAVCIFAMVLGSVSGSLPLVVGSLIAILAGALVLFIYYAARELKYSLEG